MELPQPTHRFPSWAPELTVNGATVTAPHADMDVFYSSDAVPARLHQQLRMQLDALAARGGTHPMPQYDNLIDPNLNAVDGLWVPTEFEVSERALVQSDVVVAIELACLSATGHRLPFGFGPLLAKLAAEGAPVVADCALRTPIPDLDPHEHFKLHVATQKLMGCALPLLARLRRPALLLPGPLQAVVKAQRIVLEEGAEYAGVWHEDGMNEHVVAVVLYYYRASPTLRGGALEFCSKQRQALSSWNHFQLFNATGDLDDAQALAATLPRCQVPITEGTLVCFSNYAAVHRVLRMEAAAAGGGGGSRDFMAFFVIDQRHPLPTPRALPPLSQRAAACASLLSSQLQPRGTFGFDKTEVYATGNGSVADVGWVRRGGQTSGYRPAGEAVSLIARLNIAPPSVERGASAMVDLHTAPRPPADQTVQYNPESFWGEAWIGEGAAASCLYFAWLGHGVTDVPPEDGVSEVRSFPRGMEQFAAFLDEQGFWCEEERLRARIRGECVELVVGQARAWVPCEQLQPIRKLRGLAHGSRCELVPFLEEYVYGDDGDDSDGGEGDDLQLESANAGGAVQVLDIRYPFDESAWPHTLAFILDPTAPLKPLERARRILTTHLLPHSKQQLKSGIQNELFRLKVNAFELGYRALWKAVAAATNEVELM